MTTLTGWKLPIASSSPSTEQVREKFRGMEICVVAIPGAVITIGGLEAVKAPVALATPSPPSVGGTGHSDCGRCPSTGSSNSGLHRSSSSVATSSAGGPSHSQGPGISSHVQNSSTGTRSQYSAPGLCPGMGEAPANLPGGLF